MLAKRFSMNKLALVGLMLLVVGILSAWVPTLDADEGPPPGSGKRLPRMYDGAPPQIPHGISGLEGACLGCHLDGASGAPIVPHPDRPSCLQCHVPQDPSVKPWVKNTFGQPPAAPRP